MEISSIGTDPWMVSSSFSRSQGSELHKGHGQVEAQSRRQQQPDELDTREERQVQELRKRDQEVRAHEQAHAAVGGPYVTSGISYDFVVGPDGQRYAVGGEVSIDTSPVAGDPEATIRKMEVVRRAALAPAEPSPQDVKVAAQASAAEREARQELVRLERERERETDAPAGAFSGFHIDILA